MEGRLGSKRKEVDCIEASWDKGRCILVDKPRPRYQNTLGGQDQDERSLSKYSCCYWL